MNEASRQNDPKNPRSANNPQDNIYEDTEKPAFSVSNDIQSLPKICYDDSNNFDTLTQQYMDVIPTLKNYYKSLKCRERIDRQILDIEMECYFNEINDNRDAALGIELILLYGDLRDILMKNHEIAQQMDKQIVQNLLTNSRNSKEKIQLDLLVDLIDSLQEQLNTTDIERNNLHTKLRELKKKSSEHANGQDTGPQEDPGTPNESSNSTNRKRNASTDLVAVPIKKINQTNSDHVELDFNRPSMSQKFESIDSGTATLRSNSSQISVMSTSQANLSQTSTSQANLSQLSTSQANLSQPSTSQANLSQPSTSQANSSHSSTSQGNLSQPSTSQGKLSQALTSQVNLLQPSASQANLSQSLTSQANSSQPSISRANLSRPSTPHANLSQPSKSQANLSQPSKSQATLSQISTSQANLLQTSASQVNLSQNSKSQANLSQPSKSQANLSQTSQSRANLLQPSKSQANLSQPSKSQANLSQPSKSQANLSQSLKSQANLTQSTTPHANLSQPSNSQANLSQPSKSQANLLQPLKSQANLLQPLKSQANLSQPSKSQANLSQSSTPHANLSQSSTPHANLSQPSKSQGNLSQPSKSQANLLQPLKSQANLSQPSKSQANLSQPSKFQANLSQPSKSQANLSETSKSQANLLQPLKSQANLSQSLTPHANLSQPSKSQANLSQPSKSQANLLQPSKSQANLSQTSTSQANLSQISKSQANLSRPSTPRANLSQPSKSQPNLSQPSKSQANVSHTSQSRASWLRPSTAQANLSQLSKSQANLSQPSKSQGNLSQTSTSQGNLSQTSKSQGNFLQTSASQANLSQSSTPHANLSQPSKSQGNLSQTSKSQTNFSQSSTSQPNLAHALTSQANLSQPSKLQANLSQSSTSQADLPQASTSQTYNQTSKKNLPGSSTAQIKVLNLPMAEEYPSRPHKLSSHSDWHTPTDFTPNVENAAEESQTNNSSRPVKELLENPIGIELKPVSIDPPRFACMPSRRVLDNCKMYKNPKSHTDLPKNAERPANVQPKHIRGLTGLSNPGGYSHINSIIQCVSNTPSFPMNLANAVQRTRTKEAIILEFGRVILSLLSHEHLTVSADALKIAFEETVCERDATRKTDPINFLKYLLQSLHRALQAGSEKRELRSSSNSLDTDIEWLKSIDGHRSIISDLFYGQKRLTTMCEICKNCTVVYEPFSSLTIPLTRSGLSALLTKSPRYDLTTMLADYFEEDRIASFECNKCGVSCNATTKIDLTRIAPILILHFERCKDDGPMNCSLLKYPLDDLNLKPFLHIRPSINSSNQKTHHYKYKLYAVCARNDVTGNDCFFAECLNPTQFTWHTFVDELVTEVTPKQVTKHTSTCCLLFYRSFVDDPDPSPTVEK